MAVPQSGNKSLVAPTGPVKGYSYIDPDMKRSRRWIVALDALEKHGKTRFALTTPGTLAYMDFDNRSEGTIEEFLAAGRKIMWRTKPDGTPWPYQIPADAGASDEKAKEVQAEARAEWKRFESDYEDLLHSSSVDTIIIDTATEAWELVRIAGFGRLNEIPPHLYSEVNGAFRRLIRLARKQTRVNLVLVHRLKDEWANEKKGDKIKGYTTGKSIRAGFSETGFLVDVNLRLTRLPLAACDDADDLGFRLTVTDCGANPRVRGLELANEAITFPNLVAAMENM